MTKRAPSLSRKLTKYKKEGKDEKWLTGYARGWRTVQRRLNERKSK